LIWVFRESGHGLVGVEAVEEEGRWGFWEGYEEGLEVVQVNFNSFLLRWLSGILSRFFLLLLCVKLTIFCVQCSRDDL